MSIPKWGRAALTGGLVLALLLTIAAGVVRWGASGLTTRDLPTEDLGAVPHFLLTDQEGRPFDSDRLKGKVWVAVFIFTRCRETCPAMTGNLLLVQDAVKAVPRLKERVRLVSFSVDPERDKPKDLSSYADNYGADRSLWCFLTGDDGAVARLSEETFHLATGRAPPAGGSSAPQLVHSDRFVLVDAAGRLRGYYSPISNKGDLGRLIQDLKQLTLRGGVRDIGQN